jgi:hypothetical protein
MLERWAHFEKVLNPNNVHLENHITYVHPSEVSEENVELRYRYKMDIELAIKELKNCKAPGTDGLPAVI